jgi:hypothetical protein
MEAVNSWPTSILLGLLVVLVSADLLLDVRQKPALAPSDSGPGPGWSLACGNRLCAAVDAGGNSYWGLFEEGPAPTGGFRWYRGGNLASAEAFGIADCRETIRSYESQMADLRRRLDAFPEPDRAGAPAGDPVESAQQRMLARIERMELQKKLDNLEAERGGAVAECRTMLEQAN